ncbi:MAG: cupin domain-containing protein [Oscillospiraceae bacterium]|nr:cupin domain-containing protein [Oscillospiraceae bacterium]
MNKIFTKTMERREADSLLGIETWGSWGCGVEKFDWSYGSSNEVCYILEGKADIITPDGVTVIEEGMVVEFPKGLGCTWDVKEPIEKFYKFGIDLKKYFNEY